MRRVNWDIKIDVAAIVRWALAFLAFLVVFFFAEHKPSATASPVAPAVRKAPKTDVSAMQVQFLGWVFLLPGLDKKQSDRAG